MAPNVPGPSFPACDDLINHEQLVRGFPAHKVNALDCPATRESGRLRGKQQSDKDLIGLDCLPKLECSSCWKNCLQTKKAFQITHPKADNCFLRVGGRLTAVCQSPANRFALDCLAPSPIVAIMRTSRLAASGSGASNIVNPHKCSAPCGDLGPKT